MEFVVSVWTWRCTFFFLSFSSIIEVPPLTANVVQGFWYVITRINTAWVGVLDLTSFTLSYWIFLSLNLFGVVKLISIICDCLQKAHVQQFLATEDALNKAAEARDLCQKLMKRLNGSGDAISSHSLAGGTSLNVGSLRQFEVICWCYGC